MNKEPLIIFDDDPNPTKGKAIKSNLRQENKLLKGIVIYPDNLKAAAKYAGIKTMADTYRTLDRLSLRKDYQHALAAHGIDMTFIVSSLKLLATNADLDSTKLKALQIFMKSLGLESYGKEEEGVSGWEDTVKKLMEAETQQPELPPANTPYQVNIPIVPEVVLTEREKEDKLGKELYDG